MQTGYSLVHLRNGTCSVRSLADYETFHPDIGPAAEAEALYVRQLRLPERVRGTTDEFVIWDVGLGAAANALTAIRLIRENLADKPARLQVASFDQTNAAAAFALEHAQELGYLAGYESALAELVKKGSVGFNDRSLRVEWTLLPGDFPAFLSRRNHTLAPPHAVLFDPHSPKKNPGMWTVPMFADLFRSLDPQRPCALATYSRSTMARTAMLLGGFFVGIGHPSGLKEETTVAANQIELLNEPLDRRWLQRVQRSDSAEPLREAVHSRTKLSAETLSCLLRHPQFQNR